MVLFRIERQKVKPYIKERKLNITVQGRSDSDKLFMKKTNQQPLVLMFPSNSF